MQLKLFKNSLQRAILVMLVICLSGNVIGQLTGIRTIPTDYASIGAFVTDLNTQGVGAGGVTLNIPSGFAETAPAGGYVITATGTIANPIAIAGLGVTKPIITANATLTAGALNDAIFKIIGGDFITISNLNLVENALNTTTAAATNNMTEWGIALLYATTADGAQNCTILNNTITLNRTYQNTFGIYANATHTDASVGLSVTAIAGGGHNGLRIFGNAISNVNIGMIVIGATAATDHNDGIDIGGSSLATGNTITNYGTTGTFSSYANVSGTVNGILVRNSKNINIRFNTVSSSVGGVISGTLNGIQIIAFNAAPTGTFTNTISNNTISLQSGLIAGAMNGILVGTTTSNITSTININNNNFSSFGHTVAGTGAITFITSQVPVLAFNVNDNTFTNMTVNTTGSVTFIAHAYAMVTGTTQTFSGNAIVTGFTKTGAGGTVNFTTSNSVSVSGSTSSYLNNIISNVNLTGATTFNGFNNTDGGTGSTKIITGNTIQNIVGGTSTLQGMNFTYWSGVSSLSNNTISGFTSAGAINGINIGSAANNATSIDVTGNTISALVSTPATTGQVIGILCSNTSALVRISGNTISGLSTSGASIVLGVLISGATNTQVFNNKIHNLLASNAAASAQGIQISGGVSVSAYNNVIGDLRAPISTTLTGVPISGFVVNGGASVNLHFNSVYLNAAAGGAEFSTAALFASTVPNLTLTNNIFINESVQNGAGRAVAYWRLNATLTTYNNSSNRNLFFVGIPSANRLIHFDGTNAYQTLALYQAAMATRDASSITGEAFTYGTAGSYFVSLTGTNANFLRPVAGIVTQTESGGINISSPLITSDFSGVVRAGNAGYTGTGSAPDLGAFEFAGISPAPLVVINSVTPAASVQCATASRVVSVNITTLSGTVTGANLLYAFNGAAQPPIALTNTSGTTWTATLPASTPVNASVTWSVVGTNSLGLSTTAAGTTYADEPLFGLTATASATNTTVCANTSTLLSAAFTPAAAPVYTLPPAVTNPIADEDLGNITISQGATVLLNNTTAINSLVGTIGIATGVAGSYSDFTSFPAITLNAGETYNFSVSSLQAATAFGNAMAIYIDYNRNGVFTDAGELVYTSPATILGAHTRTGTFVVPALASPGAARMRVISNEGLITSPTQTVFYGEYEEYAVILSPSFTVTWMNGATMVGTGNPLTANPAATTTYTANITSSGCVLSPAPAVTVSVTALPSTPTRINSAQCGTQIPTASVASTSGLLTPTFNWYTVATGGTAAQSGTSTTFLSTVAATATYHVSELNTTTGCESARIAVTITVAIADGILASSTATSICIGSPVTLTASNTNATPNQLYTYTWTNATAGSGLTSLTGASQTITPTLPGTYVYSLSGVDGGCSALSSRTITVNPFTATLTAVNITCNGANNGSFALGTTTCGTAPYVYSVGGAAFGAIPTNLMAGAYSVVVRDANLNISPAISITITQPIPVNIPTTTGISVCQDVTSANVTAAVNLTTTTTINLPLNITAQPIEVNAAPGNIVTSVTVPAIPVGATVTGVVITLNGLIANGGSWQSDVRLGLSGVFTNAAATGTGALNAAGTFNYTRTITNPAGFPTVGGTMNLLYWDDFNDVNPGDDCTFPIGVSVGSIVITYTQPNPTTISWFTGTTGGTSIGTGSPFQTVGTTLLPTTAAPGTYTFYAQGNNGACTSATRTPVVVTVNAKSTSSTTVVNCGPFLWNAISRTASGTYTFTTTNAAGCDSVATLNLTVNSPSASTTTASNCVNYTWTNGTTYTASGTYTQTLANAVGCDSVATLNLTILAPTTSATTISNCVNYTWTNGTTYTASGTYTQTLVNAAGCDSVATLNLTVLAPSASTTTISNCVDYTWTNGTTYTASGTYTQTLVNAAGCDSVATLNLTIFSPTTSTTTVSSCGDYTWTNGTTYSTSGSYTQTLVNAEGCDSVATLQLTINGLTATATNNGDLTLTASAGAAYSWINCATNTAITGATSQTYTATANGNYAVIVTNAAGCSDTSDCVTVGNVSIKEIAGESVAIFPNPTTDIVEINFSSATADVEVMDAQGKLVFKTSIQSGDKVSLANYDRGVYYFRLSTKLGTSIHKVVKN